MPNDPAQPSPQSMRAADADRERVVSVLQEAFAQGRLTIDEFHERSGQAYAAKTLGDLTPLTADLPAHDLAQVAGFPSAEQGKSVRTGPRLGSGSWSPVPVDNRSVQRRRELKAIWATWVTVSIITSTIWLLTCISAAQLEGFWPIWPIGVLGAGALARTINGSGHQNTARDTARGTPRGRQQDRDRHRSHHHHE